MLADGIEGDAEIAHARKKVFTAPGIYAQKEALTNLYVQRLSLIHI